ncbi:MAG TPA: HlyD family efflux transporter periplasmic adaptor subunit [Anaerolineae bacterium]|mgnify:CR=1 FL=1|nr:HlyD family efflux transporter periplasmic adaptor subunit [Anaerolineales bacterium]HRV91650.1 HlyD family efflux transporter periplasmic adaptor subunit [Anaerolineae bacterium]
MSKSKILKHSLATVMVALSISFLVACGSAEEPTPEPVDTEAVQQPKVVSAEAFVVPVKESDLAFETGGRVVAIEVDEGESVKEGDVLVRLDDSAQQTALAEAQATLAQTKARKAEAEARLAEAASGLAEAEANLSKVKAGPTDAAVAQLQASLAKAEAALADMIAGPTPEEIAEAGARVQTAQAELNQVTADTRDEDLQASAARVLKAEADVREAQDDYDQVRYGDPDDVLVTGVALEKFTLEYEAAKAEYDKLVNGATAEEIATAQARVAEARASLNRVQAGSTPEEIAQAQADVAAAQAQLDDLLAGSTDEDIAIAEAQVESAQAGISTARANVEASETEIDVNQARVESAQVELDKTTLKAPFSGEVSSLNNVDEGEIVQAGSSVVSLGDTSKWQIETDDLTEIDIVDVQVGANVTISVDALPGEDFEGKVVKITPKSETKAGDVTYTVLIDITKGPTARLRWGMTTFVDIEASPEI